MPRQPLDHRFSRLLTLACDAVARVHSSVTLRRVHEFGFAHRLADLGVDCAEVFLTDSGRVVLIFQSALDLGRLLRRLERSRRRF